MARQEPGLLTWRCHADPAPLHPAPMKTSVFYYCAFAVVVLSSVLFGLDWQPATMSSMPPIQVVALPPPPPKPAEPMAAPIPAAPPVAVAPKPAAPRALAPS